MSTGTYKVVSDYTMGVSTNTNLQVFVRARPPAKGDDSKELAAQYGVSTAEPRRIELKNRTGTGGDHAFSFDRVFWTGTSQEEIFSTVCQQQVDHCLRGYNSCSFAYGQTGSGKTHTMFGGKEKDRGLIPRSVEYLFAQIPRLQQAHKDVKVEASFLEIYCGKIRDLGRTLSEPDSPGKRRSSPSMRAPSSMINLTTPKSPGLTPRKLHSESNILHNSLDSGYVTTSDAYLLREAKRGETFGKSDDDYSSMDLPIHEDQMGEVFVKDLTQVQVSSCAETLKFVSDGFRLRATHETKMNNYSSRSHTIFTLRVTLVDKSTGSGTCARINLVDLAGSERLKKSESEGMRLKEALSINSSLTALGKVVVALDPKAGAGVHVPYRDDKLTRVLQNSLGGNSYTTLVATIHPNDDWADECLSTLQFANRCRVVTNLPRVTYTGEETSEAKDKRIKALMEENKQLRRRLVGAGLGAAGEEGDIFDLLSGGGNGSRGGISGLGASGASSGNVLQRQRLAIAQAANAMIVKVLAECGISSKLNSDGRVELSDGRVVGHYCEPVGDSPAGGSDDVGFEDLLGVNRSSHGGNEKLSRKVALLQRESDTLRKKLAELREKSDAEKSKFESQLLAQQHELRTAAALTQAESEKQRRVLSLAAEGATAALAANTTLHNEHVRTLMDRSDEILRQQAQLAALRSDLPSSKEAHSQDSQSDTVKVSRSKVAAAIATTEFTKNAEIELLKQQYEHWLSLRDEEASRFVSQFNGYREKVKTKMGALENDLIRVFSFAKSLQNILENIELGEYHMRSTSDAGVLTPCIPSRDKPYEPYLLQDEPAQQDGVLSTITRPRHLSALRNTIRRKSDERKLAKDLTKRPEESEESGAVAHALKSLLDSSLHVRHNQCSPSNILQGSYGQAGRTKSIDSFDKLQKQGIGSLAAAARNHRPSPLLKTQIVGENSTDDGDGLMSALESDMHDLEIDEVVTIFDDARIESLPVHELKSSLKSLRGYLRHSIPVKVMVVLLSLLCLFLGFNFVLL